MKFQIASYLQKLSASIIAWIIALFGCTETPSLKVRPDANTVTPYSTQEADYTLDTDISDDVHDISDLLFGIFFEDINFSADGGLYAEKTVNRSFEFKDNAKNDSLYGWSTVNNADAQVIENDTVGCLNENNTNYLTLSNSSESNAGIANGGFLDGISVESGKNYNFSLYAKALDGYDGTVTVRLTVGEKILVQGIIEAINDKWQKYELTLKPTETANENVILQVLIEDGKAAFDMISLFPVDTYKGRENGLRADLCEKLEELHSKFVRFPGGCVIEGTDSETAYSWKDSVGVGSDGEPLLFCGKYGDVAARKQGIDIWTDLSATDDPYPSFMTYGLGFFEYFQLCEDIGSLGVPVLNSGLYCQMRGKSGVDINSEEFAQYVQDMLDLVEFCRGDETSTWGKVRCSLGHTEPFELKYIAIGNENEGEDYFVRYQAFLDALNSAKAQNPNEYNGIELIYSAGACDALSGGNYIKSYQYAASHISGDNASEFAGAVDQHYYNTPDWFLKNTDYYDEINYKRNVSEMTDTVYGGAIPVFLGEYAAQSNTLKAALSEAAYMTGLERNGDIVRMASYAPLFGNTTACHWSPDLIWFNNHTSAASVNYYIQKLFMNNTGSVLLSSSLGGAQVEQPKLKGRIGVGTWYTEAEFDNLKVVDNSSGKTICSDSFTLPDLGWNYENPNNGNFKVKGGKFVHIGTDMNYSDIGDVAYFGSDSNMTDYTFTVEATKTDGQEGFLIPFAVQDKNNNYFWNLGGWGNTVSCVQKIENGSKSGQIVKTVKPFIAETGKTYKLKVVVSGTAVQCYVDDVLYVDYDTASSSLAQAYQVVSTDDSGDIIIKLVNVTDEKRTFAVNITGGTISTGAKVSQVSGLQSDDENKLGQKEKCSVDEFTLDGVSSQFNYTVPQYSATVIRISK